MKFQVRIDNSLKSFDSEREFIAFLYSRRKQLDRFEILIDGNWHQATDCHEFLNKISQRWYFAITAEKKTLGPFQKDQLRSVNRKVKLKGYRRGIFGKWKNISLSNSSAKKSAKASSQTPVQREPEETNPDEATDKSSSDSSDFTRSIESGYLSRQKTFATVAAIIGLPLLALAAMYFGKVGFFGTQDTSKELAGPNPTIVNKDYVDETADRGRERTIPENVNVIQPSIPDQNVPENTLSDHTALAIKTKENNESGFAKSNADGEPTAHNEHSENEEFYNLNPKPQSGVAKSGLIKIDGDMFEPSQKYELIPKPYSKSPDPRGLNSVRASPNPFVSNNLTPEEISSKTSATGEMFVGQSMSFHTGGQVGQWPTTARRDAQTEAVTYIEFDNVPKDLNEIWLVFWDENTRQLKKMATIKPRKTVIVATPPPEEIEIKKIIEQSRSKQTGDPRFELRKTIEYRPLIAGHIEVRIPTERAFRYSLSNGLRQGNYYTKHNYLVSVFSDGSVALSRAAGILSYESKPSSRRTLGEPVVRFTRDQAGRSAAIQFEQTNIPNKFRINSNELVSNHPFSNSAEPARFKVSSLANDELHLQSVDVMDGMNSRRITLPVKPGFTTHVSIQFGNNSGWPRVHRQSSRRTDSANGETVTKSFDSKTLSLVPQLVLANAKDSSFFSDDNRFLGVIAKNRQAQLLDLQQEKILWNSHQQANGLQFNKVLFANKYALFIGNGTRKDNRSYIARFNLNTGETETSAFPRCPDWVSQLRAESGNFNLLANSSIPGLGSSKLLGYSLESMLAVIGPPRQIASASRPTPAFKILDLNGNRIQHKVRIGEFDRVRNMYEGEIDLPDNYVAENWVHNVKDIKLGSDGNVLFALLGPRQLNESELPKSVEGVKFDLDFAPGDGKVAFDMMLDQLRHKYQDENGKLPDKNQLMAHLAKNNRDFAHILEAIHGQTLQVWNLEKGNVRKSISLLALGLFKPNAIAVGKSSSKVELVGNGSSVSVNTRNGKIGQISAKKKVGDSKLRRRAGLNPDTGKFEIEILDGKKTIKQASFDVETKLVEDKRGSRTTRTYSNFDLKEAEVRITTVNNKRYRRIPRKEYLKLRKIRQREEIQKEQQKLREKYSDPETIKNIRRLDLLTMESSVSTETNGDIPNPKTQSSFELDGVLVENGEIRVGNQKIAFGYRTGSTKERYLVDSNISIAGTEVYQGLDYEHLFSIDTKGRFDFDQGSQIDVQNDNIAATCSDGLIRIYSITQKGKLKLSLRFEESTGDWIAFTPEGLFDGSFLGRKRNAFRLPESREIVPVDTYFSQYFYPGLVNAVLKGETPSPDTEFRMNVKAPIPSLVFKQTQSRGEDHVALFECSFQDTGAGIGSIQLKHNGQFIANKLKKISINQVYPLELKLSSGVNKIELAAFDQDDSELSSWASVELDSNDVTSRPTLHCLAIGINDYKTTTPFLNSLDYCVADATAMESVIKSKARRVFNEVEVTKLVDKSATKQGILKAVEQIAIKANPQDTLLLFVASHGITLGQRFYIVPHGLKPEDGNYEQMILDYALPVDELADELGKVKALKRAIIFDTCQSGSSLDLISSEKRNIFGYRGVSDRLSYSQSVAILAATNSLDFAVEDSELQHSILTYCLLIAIGEVESGPLANKKSILTAGKVNINDWFEQAATQTPLVYEAISGSSQQPQVFAQSPGFVLFGN